MTPIVGVVLASVFAVYGFGGQAAASGKMWSNLCESCHNGTVAPAAESLRERYRSVEEFKEAVRTRGDRCMNILRNDEKMIERVAREIGIAQER